MIKPISSVAFIINRLSAFTLWLPAIVLAGCGEPKFDHLLIKNDTDMTLNISMQFKESTTKLTPITLESGAEDGWRFSAKEAELVESLQHIRAKTSECEISFSKEQLKTMIQKDGAYRLIFTKNLIDCQHIEDH